MCFGISSSFWKWEHIEHHTFTNIVDSELNTMSDPQHDEEVWVQDEKLFGIKDVKNNKVLK